MERAGEAAHVLEGLHPDIPHAWRAKLHASAATPPSRPATEAPPQAWIAYFTGLLDRAFARGYHAQPARDARCAQAPDAGAQSSAG
jgi:hypothetical protein